MFERFEQLTGKHLLKERMHWTAGIDKNKKDRERKLNQLLQEMSTKNLKSTKISAPGVNIKN